MILAFLWPISAAIVSSENPRSAAIDAKLWRSTWGVMSAPKLARFATRTQILVEAAHWLTGSNGSRKNERAETRDFAKHAASRMRQRPQRRAGLCILKLRRANNETTSDHLNASISPRRQPVSTRTVPLPPRSAKLSQASSAIHRRASQIQVRQTTAASTVSMALNATYRIVGPQSRLTPKAKIAPSKPIVRVAVP